MSLFYTDTHAHIHSNPLDRNLTNIITNAKQNNVKRIITIGTDLADSKDAAHLASKHSGIFAAVGVHPHYASEFNYKELGAFEELAEGKKVIAIGEVGLDFYRNKSPKDVQMELFTLMADLALGANLPLIIHSREANEDTLKVLNSVFADTDHKILFHCFNGHESLSEWGLERDNVYYSFAGNTTYKKAFELHDALKRTPLDRMFIETDCPYLTPEPFRGKQNEPALIVHTAQFVVNQKSISVDDLQAQLEKNFNYFFGDCGTF